MTQKLETYIGDGVYAEYDGYGITLYTVRSGGEKHYIYLEPRELNTLILWAEAIKKSKEL